METKTKENIVRSKLKTGIVMTLAVIIICLLLKISKEFIVSLVSIILLFVFIPIIVDNNIYSIRKKVFISVILALTGAIILLTCGKANYPLSTYAVMILVVISVSFIKYFYKNRNHRY